MPQNAWSPKDERQYEHVKESEREQGRSLERAKEIAARTVNKQRSSEGRTKEQQESNGRGHSNGSGGGSGSGGGGAPGKEELQAKTKRQLYNLAKDLEIEGRSAMSKSQLVRAIRQRQ